jgi:hypothetical protein
VLASKLPNLALVAGHHSSIAAVSPTPAVRVLLSFDYCPIGLFDRPQSRIATLNTARKSL